MEPIKAPLEKGNTPTNHQFLGSMLIFRGVFINKITFGFKVLTHGQKTMEVSPFLVRNPAKASPPNVAHRSVLLDVLSAACPLGPLNLVVLLQEDMTKR